MNEAPVPPPERLVTPKRAEEDAAEAGAAPADARRFRRPEAGPREPRRSSSAAAKSRGEALDHVLFHGPPGLGKTTLAQIVAREMGVGFRATSGPVIQNAGDLAAQLTNLQPHDVLFIDEIHRLAPAIEEVLYPGDGGFPARPHDRRGAGRALGAHRSAALHAGRRHDALGPDDAPVARALRHSAAPRVLRAGRARDDRASCRARARRCRWPRTAARRSPGARAARRAWPTACCAACATSRRSADRRWSTQRRRCGADAARGRRARARRHGSPLPRLHRRELRRRAGRRRDAGGGAVRAARRDRGRDRALPDAARPADAHAARPDAVAKAATAISAWRCPRIRSDSSTCWRPATRRRRRERAISGGRRPAIFPMASMSCRYGFITRTPTRPASSTTPTGCASSSAAAPNCCGCSARSTAPCSDERGVHWVVRRCTIDYLKPARLDETIEVMTRCGELRGASLDMIQQARRGEEILVRAEIARRLHGRRRPAGPIAAASAHSLGPSLVGRLAPLAPYSGINL